MDIRSADPDGADADEDVGVLGEFGLRDFPDLDPPYAGEERRFHRPITPFLSARPSWEGKTGSAVISEGIFGRVKMVRRPVGADILNSQHAHGSKQRPPRVLEGNGRVVREPLLDQDMAVEPPHLLDREHADAAERLGVYIEHFPFSRA